LAHDAEAEIRLPEFFSDHMVLQQESPIKVWGWAEPNETVAVSIGENTTKATAGDDGKWMAELPAMKASPDAVTVTVKGTTTIELKDVLIGEVWLCSGQSNMEWTVQRSSNSKAEIAAANFPHIRHMKAPRTPSTVPKDDIKTKWEVCSPKTVANFTACGYFMARRLHKELGVPVGLINSSWGGTRVEPWTPPVGFEKVPALKGIYTSVMGRTPGTSQFKDRLGKHIRVTEAWLDKAKAGFESNASVAASPTFPAQLTPFKSHQDPTMLYNGMIHAMVGLPIRGAIWYQGESNHNEGMLYYEKKKALINGWRELWGQGDFPFYYVQIAPFQYGNEDPTILAKFWEAQAKVQELPNTAMVVINDIATLRDIHPPNKQDVGLRLANLALKNDYGRDDVVAHSPEMEKLQIADGKLTITFKNTGGGLKTRDGKPATLFEVIGSNSNGFQTATAAIDGDSVVLTSDKVKQPTAFRFAWNKLAEPNLTGGTGLPVGAFRGGEVPEFLNTLPNASDLKLVYDLDLSKLGSSIKYDVDNSDSVAGFERIGYLVELQGDAGPQQVFVSMKAFTKDAKKIGIPTAASQAKFQQKVEAMHVFSTVNSVKGGTNIGTGNIEFWPNNYGPANHAKIPNATNVYDFGDQISAAPVNGYGSMQVHNHGAKQTVFAINHWAQGANADIGIGNSTGDHRDWTFTGSAKNYSAKRLRVFVR
jgi:sialate O-acetylesterase